MKKIINKIKCYFGFHDTKESEPVSGWIKKECKDCDKLIYKKRNKK